MANKNLNQIFTTNPITTNASTDLMYFMQSPYSAGTDAGMTFANFSTQFGAPYTAAALTRTNDTNVTLTLGGTPATALLQATSLTLGWTGLLDVTRGGTNANSFTAYSLLCAGTTSTGAFQNVSGLGTTGQVLTSNGAGALPTWQTAGGGGSPAGANNDIQFNESGAFTADTGNFTWNPVLHSLNCGDGTNTPLTASYNYFFGTGNHCASSQTTSTYCMLIGNGNTVRAGANCMLIGGSSFVAQTNASFGIGWGNGGIVGGAYSFSFGHNTSATGSNSFVTGFDATSNGFDGCFVAGDSQASGITGASAADQCVLAFVGGFYYQNANGNIVTIDTVGNLTNIKGTADQSYSLQVPTTGFSITMSATSKTLILNPAGTLLAGTINLPASPIDGQEIRVSTSQAITSLTVSGNGHSIVNAPTTLALGTGFSYIYNTSGTTWYRLY